MTHKNLVYSEFVQTTPGGAYRLLPIGPLFKGGKKRMITPEMLAQFKLPHFKPPIKLGSHADASPAGGHIVGLEVREDGLYAIPEHTPNGTQALTDGAYRYHSPEIIWEGGYLENPTTGEKIPGPLIVGDALLHMPHLGEAAALYTSEIQSIVRSDNMTEELQTVTVPLSWFEKLTAKLFQKDDEPQAEPAHAPAPESDDPDQFAAIAAERDEYRAELDALKAEQATAAKLAHFGAELAETVLAEADDAPAMLAGMTDEQAAWVVQQFKALSAQADAGKLTEDLGAVEGDEPDAKTMIDKLAAEKGLTFAQAFDLAQVDHPEWFK